MVAQCTGMLWLGDWQLHRAESGNALSWAYTFEWPIFAIFAVVFWAKTIRDEFHPPAQAGRRTPSRCPPGRPGAAAGRPGPAGDAASQARTKRNSPPTTPTSPACTKEVRGHGRWHGLASSRGKPRQQTKEVGRVRLNVTLYRVMAYVTGVVLIVLCVLAIIQAFADDSAMVNVVGTIHGGLYIVYLIVSFPLTRRLRLPPGRRSRCCWPAPSR